MTLPRADRESLWSYMFAHIHSYILKFSFCLRRLKKAKNFQKIDTFMLQDVSNIFLLWIKNQPSVVICFSKTGSVVAAQTWEIS